MWWLALGCLLGGFGALLGHWQSPLASWAKISGVAVFMIGLFGWLISSGLMSGRTGDGCSGSDSGDWDDGDSGGCDGGD
jgi:hypothetical protein